jgi:ATP-dependent Clp protease adaptor protein ClpS
MSNKDPLGGRDSVDGLAVAETRPKLKRPPLYKVLLLNDDYTPMEFVVTVLQQIFSKQREDAVRIMLHVHTKGMGVCGVFTRDVAETKVDQVMNFSQENKHPLQCTLELD